MTTAATIAADRPLLTRPFLGWLSAAAVAAVGDGVLYFAFGWVATGYGARTAGWLLSLALFPRILFMLVGGALGDRWGLRTTLQRTQTGTLFVLALVASPRLSSTARWPRLRCSPSAWGWSARSATQPPVPTRGCSPTMTGCLG